MADAGSASDLKSCFICSGALRDQVNLSCKHQFCFDCLDTWYQSSKNKNEVACPVCKKTSAFPKKFLTDMATKFTDSKDAACHVCQKKAQVHCTDCNKSLCHQCQVHHNTFTEDHHTVTIQDLASGQVSTKGRVCKEHGVKVRYYCETEEKQVCVDCIGLNTCPPEHKRLALKEAARRHVSRMEMLRKKTCMKNKKLQKAIKDIIQTISDLCDSVKEAKSKLVKCKQEYIQQVERVFDEKISEIERVQNERVKEMEDKQKAFESEVSKLEEVDNQALNLTASKSDYLITHTFPMISKAFNALNPEKLDKVDWSMRYLEYESVPMSVPNPGYIKRTWRWRLARTMPLALRETPTKTWSSSLLPNKLIPKGLAINQNGDVIVASSNKIFNIFPKSGEVNCFPIRDFCEVTDIAVSHDNRYVLAVGREGIGFITKDGKRVSDRERIYRRQPNYKSSLTSLAVDANDQIIAGHNENIISIHYADGSLASTFNTKSRPLRLATTSQSDIVCSFSDRSCLLMDYSGSNIRVVQPPPGVITWVPGCVCCRGGEIFVTNSAIDDEEATFTSRSSRHYANTATGYPEGIFRYTAKGHYLRCVTIELRQPVGIALSNDGMEMYVVEHEKKVKIFHRE